jgi:DNA-directed RNA polymerase subunit RPC12/RpoP
MMIRLGRLDVQLVPGGPGTPTRIAMAGRIDDSAALGELVAEIPAGGVVIDTSAVTFINSIGMREWMRLARALRDRGTPAVLERVADVLMTQMNMFPEFATSVQIVSFHAQYVCSACGAEAAPLVDAVARAAELRRLRPPRLPCPECGAQMDLGDFPERYLTIFRG